MAFFQPDKLKPMKIEMDRTSLSADSPEMARRLARIEQNYGRLEDILIDLESKIAADERLQAMNEKMGELEISAEANRKRKWRSSKAKKKPSTRNSANPRKPR